MFAPDDRRKPPKGALLSLVADSVRAVEITQMQENSHFLYEINGEQALVIGHVRSKTPSKYTIATIGREPNADIFVPDPDISRSQCSFELNDENDCILLRDTSTQASTHIFGEKVFDLRRVEDGPRRVALVPSLKANLGLGRKLEPTHSRYARQGHMPTGWNYRIRFRIVWHVDCHQAASDLRHRVVYSPKDAPRFNRTLEAPVETALPSRTSHTPTQRLGKRLICVRVGKPIGSGTFGEVSRALDVYGCRYVAEKRLIPPSKPDANQKPSDLIEKEMENLFGLKHVRALTKLSGVFY